MGNKSNADPPPEEVNEESAAALDALASLLSDDSVLTEASGGAVTAEETEEPDSGLDPRSQAFLHAVPKLFASIAGVYSHWLQEFGVTPRGAGWSSPERQQVSFDALLKLIPPDAKAVSVVDVGCGYGALFDRIKDEPWFEGGRYLGVDICRPMISAAQVRIRDSRARFDAATLPPLPGDYAFAHGVYNFDRILDSGELKKVPRKYWTAYVKASLHGLSNAGPKGFGFTMLSDTAPEKEPNLHYAPSGPYLEFCRRSFAGEVTLLDDYTEGEWAILVKR